LRVRAYGPGLLELLPRMLSPLAAGARMIKLQVGDVVTDVHGFRFVLCMRHPTTRAFLALDGRGWDEWGMLTKQPKGHGLAGNVASVERAAQ